MNLSEILGIIGVGLILAAYFCNTFNLIKKEGVLFYILNTVGAAIACASSWLIPFYPFVVLEAVWTVVSVIALLKLLRSSST